MLLDPDWAGGTPGRGRPPRARRAAARTLPPKWLYDDVGSELFDEITRLPEYYPTERGALDPGPARRRHRRRPRGATTLVELGSGTSDKTRILLDAFTDAGQLDPVRPGRRLGGDPARGRRRSSPQRYPETCRSRPWSATSRCTSGTCPRDGRRMVAFLGGTIGNLYVEERAAFLGALADSLEPGDWLLLGTDLVKSADRLIAAYDDPGGVTAAVRHELPAGAQRPSSTPTSTSTRSPTSRSGTRGWSGWTCGCAPRCPSTCRSRAPASRSTWRAARRSGSRSRRSSGSSGIAAELGAAGFDVERSLTDDEGDFALTLARRTG